MREVREVILLLYLIFRKSLEEGRIPTAWKDAFVMALYKSGDTYVEILHLIIGQLV